MRVILGILLIGWCAAAEWRWKGKVALVTSDKSSPIGLHLATNLAAKGMKVALVGKAMDGSKPGSEIKYYECSLVDEQAVVKVFEDIKKDMDHIHVLINAAETNMSGNILDGDFKAWKEVMMVNVLATALIARESVKLMPQEAPTDSHIIDINSITTDQVHMGADCKRSIYTASKYAMNGLHEQLQSEMASNVGIMATTKFTEIRIPTITGSGFILEDLSDAVIYALNTRPGIAMYELKLDDLNPIHCSTG